MAKPVAQAMARAIAAAMRLPMAQGTAPSGSQAKPLPSTYGGHGLWTGLMKSFMRGQLCAYVRESGGLSTHE